MGFLGKWYSAFDNSGLIRRVTNVLFHFLPEGARGHMPHHVATYILVGAVCLVLTIATMGLRKKQTGAGFVITPIAVAIGLVLAIPMWGDPPGLFMQTLEGFGELFSGIPEGIAHFSFMGMLEGLLFFAVLVVSILFYGLLLVIPAAPVGVAIYIEIREFGLFSPISFVGHSVISFVVLAAIGVGFALTILYMLPFAVIMALLAVIFFR